MQKVERREAEHGGGGFDACKGGPENEFRGGEDEIRRRERNAEQKRQRAVTDGDGRMEESSQTGQHLRTDRLRVWRSVFARAGPDTDQKRGNRGCSENSIENS